MTNIKCSKSFFKVFFFFLAVLVVFVVCGLNFPEACGILVTHPMVEPASPALEGDC